MIQVDGNDTVVDDITGLNEAEIYERDPELLFSAYVFEDTIVPATNQPTATNKTASFALNKDKQIESLVADTNLVDFKVIVNDDDKNVGIQCSTAFYEAVAKPV